MSVAAEEMTDVPALLHDEPMARHTSWRVGGPADPVFQTVRGRRARIIPCDAAQGRSRALHRPRFEPARARRRYPRRGHLHERLAEGRNPTRRRARSGCGRDCPVRRWHGAACAGSSGPRRSLRAYPGTVGGALAMNAGAFGGETWDNVESVTTIDRSGAVHARSRAEFSSGYRNVCGPEDEWFLDATFRFEARGRGRYIDAPGHAAQARRYATAGSAERGLRVPQSARKLRRPAHRAGGPQGSAPSAARRSPVNTRISSSTRDLRPRPT